jgi:hypothetical protein
VIGRCERTTGIAPFTRLVNEVMSIEPYASARRGLWIAAHRAFQDHYNRTAKTFDWTFSRTDLNKLLARISRHEPDAPYPATARSTRTNLGAHPLVAVPQQRICPDGKGPHSGDGDRSPMKPEVPVRQAIESGHVLDDRDAGRQ